jgi:hypothetical protein
MEKTVTIEPPADDAALQAGITQMIAQIKEIRERMASDQKEIERLKSETAVLKRDGEALRSQTRSILAALNQAM